MTTLIESMETPVDNLLGLFLYAALFILITGLIMSLLLHFIPNSLSRTLKSFIVGIAVFSSLFFWWYLIVV
ncbi:hypothetical protein [Paraliobacillus sediminis]|uniref:hypothetical protein n=1 Tax=Paraliobacillus sediminis TaxID=1885916 RepID=UPI000E3DD4C2|nr:hypothetical protein [Paraliobacillus sediminis]